jgi:hypothetical protein
VAILFKKTEQTKHILIHEEEEEEEEEDDDDDDDDDDDSDDVAKLNMKTGNFFILRK